MEVCALPFHPSSDDSIPPEPSYKFQSKLDDLRHLHAASTYETDRQTSTLPQENQNKKSSTNDDEDDILKRTLTFYNVVQNGGDLMHVSLYATIGATSLEQLTLHSTIEVVPTDTEDLKAKLSQYQERLYKRFSVKLTDLVRLETLGKGAFGEVTRVFNKTDREFYALKEVRRQSFKKAVYYESAVWTEIQNLLTVTYSHNNSLLKTILIEFDENQDVCYLLMELGNGTLEEYSECKRKHHMAWTAKELEYVLSQLVGQVLKLKELGMYHRDIKPSNVIISTKEDAFKLSDLGCACLTHEGVQKMNITGTPHFMSPELLQGVMARQIVVEHDPFASDLYSVGVTILSLLEPALKRKDFKRYLDEYVKENYPGLYPILRDLLGAPDKRREAVDKVLGTKLVIQSYKHLESVSVGEKYKVYLYCKIVSKNKNIDTSFYFDMFILDDALLVIQKQIFLLTEKMKEGDLSLEEVAWRVRLARCYYLQLKYEEASKELESIMRRKELKNFDTQNVLTKARALLWLGIVRVKLGHVEQAIDDLMHCLGIRIAEFGEVHEDVLAVFWQLGDTHLTQENLTGARKAFQKCIEIGEKLGPTEKKHMAKSYNSLGLMLERQEKYEEALEYFIKAKETAILTHGSEHHPAVADEYLSIAHVYIVLGKNDEGLALCRRALEIKAKWYGENNPEVAAAYAKISIIHDRLGQYQKVQELLQRSVSIWKTVSGEDSQELAEVYQLLGNAVCKKGQYKKGLEYADKVIKIKEKHLASDNPRLAADYVWHAETCHALGQEAEKQESLSKFLKLDFEKLHPNLDSVRVVLRVSNLLGEEGQVEQAWEYAQKGFQMCKHLAVPRISNVYSYYYETVGRLRKAEGKYQVAMEDILEAITIRDKNRCKDYDVIAGLYGLMGSVCEESEQYLRALDWYRQSEAMIEKYLNKGSLQYLKALLDLARILEKLGNNEESMPMLEAGYNLLIKVDIKDDHYLAKSYLQIKQKIMSEKGVTRKYSNET